MPSFHALSSCTECSQHRVLKASKHTVVFRCSHCANVAIGVPLDCGINIVTSSRHLMCQGTSLAGNRPKKQLSNFTLAHGTRSLPTPGKPGANSSQIPQQQLRHRTSAAVHPIGWIHPPPRGKPCKDTTHSHRPEGFSSTVTTPPSVTSAVHYRNARSASPSPPWQAKATQVWAVRALLRRTFIDGASRNPSQSRLLPKTMRKKQSAFVRQTILSVA